MVPGIIPLFETGNHKSVKEMSWNFINHIWGIFPCDEAEYFVVINIREHIIYCIWLLVVRAFSIPCCLVHPYVHSPHIPIDKFHNPSLEKVRKQNMLQVPSRWASILCWEKQCSCFRSMTHDRKNHWLTGCLILPLLSPSFHLWCCCKQDHSLCFYLMYLCIWYQTPLGKRVWHYWRLIQTIENAIYCHADVKHVLFSWVIAKILLVWSWIKQEIFPKV